MSWSVSTGISTPRGVYTPVTDNLTKELVEAAKFAGLTAFNVKIDGHYVVDSSALQTNSISALSQEVSVEGIEPVSTIEVEAHDTAG